MGPKKCLKSSRHVFHHPKAKQRPQNTGKRYRNKNGLHNRVAIAQLLAPKVVSSILTCHIATRIIPAQFFSTPCQTKKCLKSSRHVFHHPKAKQRPQTTGKRYRNKNGHHNRVAIAQLARRSHNPKVVSSTLTCHIATRIIPAHFFPTPCQTAVAVAPGSSALPESAGQPCLRGQGVD